MIKYRLVCGAAHEFEGWFKSSDAFECQSALHQVACPSCGATDVTKAVMAPAIRTGVPRRAADTAIPAAAGPHAPAPHARVPHAYVPPAMAEIVRRVRAEVAKSAEYVGGRFAEEARRIHYEERPERGIYGEASPREVAELDAEGITVFPLPTLPEEHN